MDPLSFMFFNNLKSTIMTIMNVIVREYSKIIEKKFRYEFVDPELSPFTSSLIVDRGITAVNHKKDVINVYLVVFT